MTDKQQARAIAKACNEAGLDSHITWHNCAADAHTWAERISVRFRDGRQPRPVKNSYMFCDTLDTVSYTHLKTYTVKSGDSLWAIAAKYLGNGSRYTEIKSLNVLSSDTIHPGQVLTLPA